MAISLLVINAFVWYYLALDFLQNVLKTISLDNLTATLIWTAHFGGIIVSAIIGALLVTRTKERSNFLIIWIVLGIASSLACTVVDITVASNVLILSLLLGVSLGVGMPCCMGYFTDSIKIERRGRVGGVVLLLSGGTMAALGWLFLGNIGLETWVLSAWRISSLVFVLLLREEKETSPEKRKVVSYKSLLDKRGFLLYFIPWVMFSLIAYLTVPIQSTLMERSTLDFLQIIETLVIAVSSIVVGFVADAVGRKRTAIVGFALLGVGYSALGINPTLPSWYFYTIVDGIAWGIFFVVFVVSIWGDLSEGTVSDKHYALGVAPFFFSKFLSLTIGTNIALAIREEAIFSFAAFFLFLAVLPLVYAPETLPEKLMKDRDLKSYAEKALKQAQKDSGKTHKKESAKAEKESGETKESEETPEDEEARKLAEKYY